MLKYYPLVKSSVLKVIYNRGIIPIVLVLLTWDDFISWSRSGHRPLYARQGGLRGAGANSTESKIAANIERGF